MTKRMLIDATHPEETRVVVLDDRHLVDFDFESLDQAPAQGQHLSRQGDAGRAVAAGGVRRVWRQPPRLPGLQRNPSRLLPDPAGRPRRMLEEVEREAASKPRPTAEPTPRAQRRRREPADDHARTPTRRRRTSWTSRPAAARRLLRSYKIQEVIKRRQIMLVQVVKEERGNKGAALTTYLSLAGRYCVLMPNTPRGGGISRKIAQRRRPPPAQGHRAELEVPDGHGPDHPHRRARSAPRPRSSATTSISCGCGTRSATPRCKSVAPEPDLRGRRPHQAGDARPLHARHRGGAGRGRGGLQARAKRLMTDADAEPGAAGEAVPRRDAALLRATGSRTSSTRCTARRCSCRRAARSSSTPTEALTAIDVNSGRSTRERHIDETAVKTNLEAADEVARQLRLRDLAGLIVIDFIDMAEQPPPARGREAAARRAEGRPRPHPDRQDQPVRPAWSCRASGCGRACRSSRARSARPAPGLGVVRSTESCALQALRGSRRQASSGEAGAAARRACPSTSALYLLNHKRDALVRLEQRYAMRVTSPCRRRLMPPPSRSRARRSARPGPAQAEAAA